MVYRAGIVGCGRIGCGFDDDPRRPYVSTHAGAYTRTAGVELVALCDKEPALLSRYGARFNVHGRYTDFACMLEAEKLDIVSVCTWNSTHLELVRAAVESGVKAILCEKPIAHSLLAADQIIRLCREHDVLLVIDHQRRFHPVHQQVAAFLNGGGLGRIQQVTCYYTAGVANTGSHLFDLLRFYLGEVGWVQGCLSGNSSQNPNDPNIDGWLGFEDGPSAALQACEVNAYMIFEVNILGTKGRLRIGSAGMSLEFEEARESQRFAEYRELFPSKLPFDFDGDYQFMLHAIAHVIECLNTGRRPVSSGEDGREALEVIIALLESSKAGGRRMLLPLSGSEITVNSR